MSNFNFEHLPGFEGQVIIGAEVVNGTGGLSLRFYQDSGNEEEGMVFLGMTYGQALDFAALLSRQAHEAMRHKWNEEHAVYSMKIH